MSNGPVCELVKNSQERIRFQVTEYRGRTFGDIRVYYEDGEEWKPSRKGICVSPGIWAEFVQGIKALGAGLEERGLLEPESEGEAE